jgi:hypothetical protein
MKVFLQTFTKITNQIAASTYTEQAGSGSRVCTARVLTACSGILTEKLMATHDVESTVY